MAILKSSSSTEGFFQDPPILLPQYTSPQHLPASVTCSSTDPKLASDDTVFARILQLYIPPGEQEPARSIHHFSRRALDPDVLAHAVDAESNLPVLKAFTTFGRENKNDPLWTTAGWKELKAIGQEVGIVSVSYEQDNLNYNRRVHQFGLGHVWACTGTMTGCPMSMTDGAAKVLSSHLNDPDGDQPGFSNVMREAYRRLISRNPKDAWTSGQWMTERSGGSDVSGTETVARRLTREELAEDARQRRDCDAHGMALGPWRIDGFKWFSSATDSDMVLMLAQTGKGLGLFYAPMKRMASRESQPIDGKPVTELNGIRIQRLKNKIGTKALPTAELELKGVRAWLVGSEASGVKEVATILNLTRLHTAAGSVGYWSRGLQVCRAYSKIRKVRGGLLQDNPQHLRWMADNTVRYHAAAHFCFFGHAMLGASEQNWNIIVKSTDASVLIPSDQTELSALLRLLTPVMKAQASVASVLGLRENMECLGGVGYCENNEDGGILNIAKIFRDNLVSPIWEGTVSVMAEDVVRVLTDKRIGNGKVIETTFAPWAQRVLAGCRDKFQECAIVDRRLERLAALTDACSKEELLFRGRELLEHLEAVVCSCLLMYDACTDEDEVATEIARRWVRSKELPGSQLPTNSLSWRNQSEMDKKIFLGQRAVLSTTALGKL
jgi:alkylation response protein AidB-like acyl-CoA dehydrogenase